MKNQVRSIYLSPHLDDVALSCGGQIFSQTSAGEAVLIVTIAAGEAQTAVRSAFAEYLHSQWGLSAEEAVAARRAEDARACQRLGADYLHLSWPDAVYRVDPARQEPLYVSDADIFGALHLAEDYLIDALATTLGNLPPFERLIAPLTVGHHVDHQRTRLAAERRFGEALIYYEEYPYIQRQPEDLKALLQPKSAWKPQIVPLSLEAFQARLEAILAYESQIGILFEDADSLAALLKEQVTFVGGERLWHCDPHNGDKLAMP